MSRADNTMTKPLPTPGEAHGHIVGTKAGCVVVRLDDGQELLCRGMLDLHRKWGFYVIPVGRRVRLSFGPSKKRKTPKIVDVLDE
jgi:hypothetical protein